MVPVRRIQNILLRRLCARQHTDHVAAGQLVYGLMNFAARLHAFQRHGLKAARLGCRLHGFEVEPGLRKHFNGHIALNPAFQHRAISPAIRAHQIRLRAAPGVGDHIPAIGCRLCFVDDQGSRCALAGGFLELVGPAAVIGHGLAIEEFRVAGGKAGIIDEDHYGFAGVVLTCIVIPTVFWRNGAIANEHDIARLEGNMVGILALGPDHGLILEGEGEFVLIGPGENEAGGGRVNGLVDHVDLLEPAAIVAARCEAEARKLCCDPGSRGFASRGAGAAPFEDVVGKRLHAYGNVCRRYFRDGAFRKGQKQVFGGCFGGFWRGRGSRLRRRGGRARGQH